jgi:hypothetical protein
MNARELRQRIEQLESTLREIEHRCRPEGAADDFDYLARTLVHGIWVLARRSRTPSGTGGAE